MKKKTEKKDVLGARDLNDYLDVLYCTAYLMKKLVSRFGKLNYLEFERWYTDEVVGFTDLLDQMYKWKGRITSRDCCRMIDLAVIALETRARKASADN